MNHTTNEPSENTFDFKLDRSNLYLEETFTDLKVGIIKRFTPVTPDGQTDKSRKAIFVGQTSIETPQGPLPIQGEIRAKELSQACKRFPEVMEELFQGIVEEVKRLQQEKKSPIIQTPESRIIVP
jgi:hypothetical protein